MMIRELFIYKQLKNPRKFNRDVLKDKFIDKVDYEYEIVSYEEWKKARKPFYF